MSKDRDRTTYRRDNGKWVNKRNRAGKASSIHDTQKEANAAARRMLKNQGGAELTTKGRDEKLEVKIPYRLEMIHSHQETKSIKHITMGSKGR